MAEPHDKSDPKRKYEPVNRCTAKNRQGNRCGRPSVPGAVVCRNHGGLAPQTVAKARQRLSEAADRMAARLIGLAENDLDDGTKVGAYVQLGAVTAALDRAGVIEQKQTDVTVTVKPFEDVFSALVGGSRSDYRASVGVPDPDPLSAPEPPSLLDVLDVEVVPDHDDTELSGAGAGDDEHQAEEPGRETLGNAPLALPGGKPGYLDTETALSMAREANAKRQPMRRR